MTEVKMQDTKLKGERENNGLYTWSSLVFCMFIKICKNYPQKTKEVSLKNSTGLWLRWHNETTTCQGIQQYVYLK